MSEVSAEQFNIHEAKTHLSRIIDQVEQGKEIVISRAGKPVAKVVPLTEHVHRVGRGSLRGKIVLAEDWDSAETNAVIAADFGLEP
jgi:prevent-host-death family protein